MEWYFYVILTVLLLFFIYLLISFLCYKFIFFHKEKYRVVDHTKDDAPEGDEGINNLWRHYIEVSNPMMMSFDDTPYEDVFIKSYDNKILHGQYFKFGDDNAPLIIGFHGYKATVRRDGIVSLLVGKKEKYNVLLVDERGHGQSETQTICFGAREKKDLLAWCYYACSLNENVKIILYGLSMGGSTVLLGASQDDLPENVKVIISDSPYDSLRNAIVAMGSLYKLHPTPLLPFVYSGAALFAHFNVKQSDPYRFIQNIKKPTLIFHGLKDSICPPKGSERLASLNTKYIKRITYENAEHVQSFIDNQEDYLKEFTSFIKQNLD